MKKKSILTVIALIAVFALVLTGCGKKDEPAAPETEVAVTDQAWGLSNWSLTATAWSSNNGANVVLTAVPETYYNNVEASFVVRLEGEVVETIPCTWDGSAYTAAVDLNAADGYCYYMVWKLDGTEAEFEVNTPSNPSNGKLINMEHSLDTYSNLVVNTSSLDGSKLTITDGSVEIHLPLITRDGKDVAYTSASLALTFGGEEVDRQDLNLPESDAEGIYQMDLKGMSFQIPELEDDQQLTLALEVILSDGQVITAPGGSWHYFDGQLLSAVG